MAKRGENADGGGCWQELSRRLATGRGVGVEFGHRRINFPGFGQGRASRPTCGFDLISGVSLAAQLVTFESLENLSLFRVEFLSSQPLALMLGLGSVMEKGSSAASSAASLRSVRRRATWRMVSPVSDASWAMAAAAS